MTLKTNRIGIPKSYYMANKKGLHFLHFLHLQAEAPGCQQEAPLENLKAPLEQQKAPVVGKQPFVGK